MFFIVGINFNKTFKVPFWKLEDNLKHRMKLEVPICDFKLEIKNNMINCGSILEPQITNKSEIHKNVTKSC